MPCAVVQSPAIRVFMLHLFVPLVLERSRVLSRLRRSGLEAVARLCKALAVDDVLLARGALERMQHVIAREPPLRRALVLPKRLRAAVVLAAAAAAASLTTAAAVVTPLLVGRAVAWIGVPSAQSMSDLYSFAVGMCVLRADLLQCWRRRACVSVL